MLFRKKYYFFNEEIVIKNKEDCGKRDVFIEKLKKHSNILGEPDKIPSDPCLIFAKFRTTGKEDEKRITSDLAARFPECNITPWVGYLDHRTREETKSLKKSVKFAIWIYVTTFVTGSAFIGFVNEVSLHTSLELWEDAIFKAAVTAIPATIVAYKKKPEEKTVV